MILDSNIIIYACKPTYAELRRFIAEHSPATSVISYVEVLGYHLISDQERTLLESFFAASIMLPITHSVLDVAVRLRQSRKTTLGDALVAATALVHHRTLVTRNVSDFAWIPGLTILNPIPDNPTS